MIIHFIGHAGCGKTTLSKAVLRIRPGLRPHSDKDKNALRPSAFLRLALPHYRALGRDLAAYNRIGVKSPGPWLWAYKTALESARRRAVDDWIIDHGFTNTMRKKSRPIDPDLASRLPFPDIIVNIGAVPAIRNARVSKRNKSPHEAILLEGNDRHDAARRQSRQWLQIWPEEVVFDYLSAFNHRHCRPLLTEEELRALITAQKDAPLDEVDQRALTYTPLPERYGWLKQVFVAQGGTWIDFENSGTSDLQQAAEDLLSRLPLQ